ncbi:MAG: cation diffusion facilitator family transporter [Patescibacteria group bacterium]
MYLIKISAKLSVGYAVNSPMIIGDGYHNVSDIFEALLVIVMIWLSRQPKNGDYPFGRKNTESIVSAVIGGALVLLALKISAESILGLLSWIPSLRSSIEALSPFRREALVLGVVGSRLFWLTLAVTGGSAFMSMLVSAYQVRIGRKSGHDSLVADGEETRSDGYIEFVTLAGVLSEYILHQPRLEYVFALAVSVKLFLTGRELFLRGYRTLLQRSIGAEIEAQIQTMVSRMCGVVKLAELKTFRVGSEVVVIMKVHTRASMEATRAMKKSLNTQLISLLSDWEFVGGELYVRFDCPSPHQHREAYAMTVTPTGEEQIATSLQDAKLIRICDVTDGEVSRAHDIPNQSEFRRLAASLIRKKVNVVHVFGAGQQEEREACMAVTIEYRQVDYADPRIYGCNRDWELC